MRRMTRMCFLNMLSVFILVSLLFTACDNSSGETAVTRQSLNDGLVTPSSTDVDGDSLLNTYEIEVLHTSPYSSDSDGDGWTDYEEAISLYDPSTNSFNPLIADIPSLSLEIASSPKFYLLSTDSKTGTQTTSVTSGSTQTLGKGTTSNTSLSTSLQNGWGLAIKTKASVLKGFSINVDASYKGSFTKTDGYSFARNESEQYQKSLSQLQSKAIAENITYSGGRIVVGVKLKNSSAISYKVNDVALTLCTFNPSNPSLITSTCELKSDASGPITLNSNSSSGILSYTADVSMEQLKQILKNQYGIAVELAGYTISITSSSGKTHDFTSTNTKIGSMTGLLAVDFGNAFPSRGMLEYAIATKTRVNTSATGTDDLYQTMYLSDLLSTAQLTTRVGLDDKGRIISVDGVGEATTPESKDAVSGAWYIIKTYIENGQKYQLCYGSRGDKCITDYSVSTLPVAARESVTITYSIDGDNDGVPYAVEKVSGTRDDMADSDGDNMSDSDELYGFERNGTKFVTNPLSNDTDKDLLLDDVDPNPLVPTWNNISTLDAILISKDGQNFDKVEFSSAPIITSGSDAYYVQTLNVSSDHIYLKIDTQSAPNVSVIYSQDDSFLLDDVEVGHKITADAISPALPLLLGKNNFVVKATANDSSNASYYIMGVKSSLKTPATLDAVLDTTESLFPKNVLLRWPAVEDTRRQYYIVTRNKGEMSKEALTYSIVKDAIAKGADGYGSEPRYYAVDKSATTFSDTHTSYNTKYTYSITPVAIDASTSVLYTGLTEEVPSSSVVCAASEKAVLTLTPLSISFDIKDSHATYSWQLKGGEEAEASAAVLCEKMTKPVSSSNNPPTYKIQGISKKLQTEYTKSKLAGKKINIYQDVTAKIDYGYGHCWELTFSSLDTTYCYLTYDVASNNWTISYGAKGGGNPVTQVIGKEDQNFSVKFHPNETGSTYRDNLAVITYALTWVDVDE